MRRDASARVAPYRPAPSAEPFVAADDAGRFTAAAAFGFFGSARFAAAVPRFVPSGSVFFAADVRAFVSPGVAVSTEALSVADFTLPPLVAPATDFAPAPDRPAS